MFDSTVERSPTAAVGTFLIIYLVLLVLGYIIERIRRHYRTRDFAGTWLDAVWKEGEAIDGAIQQTPWGGGIIEITASENGFEIVGASYEIIRKADSRDNPYYDILKEPKHPWDGKSAGLIDKTICYHFGGYEVTAQSGVCYYHLTTHNELRGDFLVSSESTKRRVEGRKLLEGNDMTETQKLERLSLYVKEKFSPYAGPPTPSR
jgi:hypothetical protein